jgi:hypothetical protein
VSAKFQTVCCNGDIIDTTGQPFQPRPGPLAPLDLENILCCVLSGTHNWDYDWGNSNGSTTCSSLRDHLHGPPDHLVSNHRSHCFRYPKLSMALYCQRGIHGHSDCASCTRCHFYYFYHEFLRFPLNIENDFLKPILRLPGSIFESSSEHKRTPSGKIWTIKDTVRSKAGRSGARL